MSRTLIKYGLDIDNPLNTVVVYREGNIVERQIVVSFKAAYLMEGLKELVSYLNEKSKTQFETEGKLEELLSASLTLSKLARIQDEVARMLHYPGIEGYIKEILREDIKDGGAAKEDIHK